MESNLTTNDTVSVLPELATEPPDKPCFLSGIPQTLQYNLFFYSNFILTPVTILLGLWCFLSNGFVLISILRGGLRIRPGFLVLCSLTLTDVVWGGLVTPVYVRFRVAELLNGQACGSRNHWGSPLMATSFFLCFLTTLGNLAVMSVDRYLAIAKPMWYKVTVTKQHAIFASGGMWLISLSIAILRGNNDFSSKAVEMVEACFVIFFSCLIIIVQISTLVTLRKHNNAVAQIVANPSPANNAIERQLTATTQHVVGLLALVIIPTGCVVGLTQVLRLRVSEFVTLFFIPIITLYSGINPVIYYKGNAQIKEGITKLVKCQ